MDQDAGELPDDFLQENKLIYQVGSVSLLVGMGYKSVYKLTWHMQELVRKHTERVTQNN